MTAVNSELNSGLHFKTFIVNYFCVNVIFQKNYCFVI